MVFNSLSPIPIYCRVASLLLSPSLVSTHKCHLRCHPNETFVGSILSCFLAHDGGPREGAIKLQPEKFNIHPSIPEETVSPPILTDDEEPRGLAKIQKELSRRFSDLFTHRPESPMNQPAVPLSSPNTERSRSFSRTSRANGSAYGYSGSYRNRVASNANFRRGSLSNSMRRRRGSNYDNLRDSTAEGSDLNFAQRLLLANENAVTNIADLWVASAMNVDNENPFEADSDIEDDDTNSLDLGVPLSRTETLNLGIPLSRTETMNPGVPLSRTETMNLGVPLSRTETMNFGVPLARTETINSAVNSDNDPSLSLSGPPFSYRNSRLPTSISAPFPRTSTINSLNPSIPVSSLRHSSSLSHRPSVSFMASPRRSSANVPSIFAHPGVKTPIAVLDAQQLLDSNIEQPSDSLHTIAESRQASQDDAESLVEKPPSLMSQLPIIVIIQYGVMALHTTTHDQIFMSYLVS